MIDINEYQQTVNSNNDYKVELGPYYTIMNIMSTTGILAEKIKQLLDEQDGVLTDKSAMKIAITLGDLLRYVVSMATDIDMSMENIILLNLKKIEMEQQKKNEQKKVVVNDRQDQ